MQSLLFTYAVCNHHGKDMLGGHYTGNQCLFICRISLIVLLFINITKFNKNII